MNNEIRNLLIAALQEETCGLPAPEPVTVTNATNSSSSSSSGNGSASITPTAEPVVQTPTNYWPLAAIAAITYLFITDGK